MTSKQNLLNAKPRVINLGLEAFVKSLRDYGSPVVQLDWQPPAGGDPRMMSLLQQLRGNSTATPEIPPQG